MSCGISFGLAFQACVKRQVLQVSRETQNQLHAYLSPFPQGTLWAWTTDIWTALELSRIIGFYLGSGPSFFRSSSPAIKALPHAHHL